MKSALVAATVGLTMCLMACEDKSAPTPKPATPPPAAKPAESGNMLDAAKKGAEDATKAATEAATELRDKAMSAFQSKYDDFKMQISTLQEKAGEVPAAAKGAFDSAMGQLNTLVKDAEAKMMELKNATGEQVKQLQDSIDGIWPKIQEQITAAEKMLKGG